MRQRFSFPELLAFWLLLVFGPLLAAGWGWSTFLQRQAFYRQEEVERELLNEAWYFQTDLLPFNALDRLLLPIRDEFGFHGEVPTGKEKWLDQISSESFRVFRERVAQQVGCRPLCAVLASQNAERRLVWWNKAYKPTRESLRLLAHAVRLLMFDHWYAYPSEEADRIGRYIAAYSKRLFGPDANITAIRERFVEFVTHFFGYGYGYVTSGHAPPVTRGTNIPRRGHFLLVFHERDLNLNKMLASCRVPFTPQMNRRLRWLDPSSLPRLEKSRAGISYLEVLRLGPFQRKLLIRGAGKHPGKVPVVEVHLPSQFCAPGEWKYDSWFAVFRCLWLVCGSILLIWLGVRGTPGSLTVKARLAWGFLLALFPSMAGVFLLLGGWLFMRDNLQPQLAVSAIDRGFEVMDEKMSDRIDQQSRWAQQLKSQLFELERVPEEQASARLGQLLEKSSFDLGFVMFSSGREVFWNQSKARSDPGMITLFKNLMRDFFRTKSRGQDSTADSLLAKTLTEQFVDAEKMGRWLERGEAVQRSPMGSVNQTIMPLFLRHPKTGELQGMVFLKGFMHFTDEHLVELLQADGRGKDLGNGFRRNTFGYGFYNPAFPSIVEREFPQESAADWHRFWPLGKRSVMENVELSEVVAGEGSGRQLVKTHFLKSDHFLCLGHLWEDEQSRLRPLLWGGALMALLLLCFWGMQRETGRFLARPMGALLSALRAAASGDLNWMLKLRSRDEFGETAEVFNHMAVKLIEREQMSRFVSEDILDRVSGGEESAIQPGQGEKVETTVLVSDIRSFTTLSEQYPADRMVEMLNDYFTAMEAGIQQEKGIIVSYIGDAIVVHFPNRPGLEDCSMRAVRAAWAMRQALKELNRERQRAGLFAIKTGIGLATGTLVSGVAGSSSGRLTQILLGEPVERATQLEVASKKARRSGIMIDGETATRSRNGFRSQPLRDEPGIYEVDTLIES